MIAIFNLTLGADEAREVAITGEYFELRNAVYPVALIELLDRSGGVVSRLENPEQSDFVRPGRFETVRITNGPTPQTVKHFYGSGDAGSRRTSGSVQVVGTVSTTGVVEVVDGGKSRTLAGGAFMGVATAGIVAAQYPLAQLVNPAGSGKNVYVKRYTVSGSQATFYTVKLTQGIAASASIAGGNKNSALAAGVAVLKNTNVAVGGLPAGALSDQLAIAAYGCIPQVMEEPILIAPGWALSFTSAAAAMDIAVGLEWIEE